MTPSPAVTLDLSFLDGFLAGDGSLYLRPRRREAVARHSTSKFGYSEYTRLRLESMGLVCRSSVYFSSQCHGRARSGGYSTFGVRTLAHPALTAQHARWYPHGRKLFPSDFRLSPDSLLQWYLGDGSLHRGLYPQITVYLPTVIDAQRLVGMFTAQFTNIYLKRQASPDVVDVVFGSGSNAQFFDFIGPCPVSSYIYRWPSVTTQVLRATQRTRKQFSGVVSRSRFM